MDLRETSAIVSSPQCVRGPTNRSCDTCYATKSRCTYPTANAPCARCAKLALACTEDRPLRRPGPKPPKAHHRAQSPSEQSIRSSSHSPVSSCPDAVPQAPRSVLSATPGPLSAALQNLSGPETRLLEFAFSASFIDAYMTFKHGQDELREVLMTSFVAAPQLVKDSLLACAGAVALQRNHDLIDSSFDTNFRRASNTLVQVRTLPIQNYHGLSILINLAMALATFSNYALGESTQSILWHVLSSVASVERDSPVQSILHDNRNMACILFLHYFECLVRSEVPAYRVRPATDFPEDRYFGVSSSILPLLFDLCQTAHQIKATGDADVVLAERLEGLMDSLIGWKPQPTLRFHAPRIERLMAAQGRCIHYAVILLAAKYSVRLSDRYSSLQYSLSEQIQNEVSCMYDKVPEQSGNLYVTFPYFISCLNTPELERDDQALVQLNRYSNCTAPATCRKMYDFLRYTWDRQKSHDREPWARTYAAGPAVSVAI